MKFVFVVLLVSVMFVSCGNLNKMAASVRGYSEVVVDGVIYLQFPSGVTVKYNKDGSIVTM